MPQPLDPARLGARLADVYTVLGPLYRQVLRRVEREEPTMGMSVGVRAVLDELRRESPATVPHLTERLGLSRQFVQRMVNEASSLGWLERRANPAHVRSPLLALTAAGTRAIEAVIAREHQLMGQTQGELTDEDIDTTLRVLTVMREAVEALEEPPVADTDEGDPA